MIMICICNKVYSVYDMERLLIMILNNVFDLIIYLCLRIAMSIDFEIDYDFCLYYLFGI